MRTLPQCQAEVFRRSKQKIAARKRRNIGILLCCIPLSAGLLLIPLLSKPPSTEKGVMMENNYSENAAPESPWVEIRCQDRSITDPVKVQQIYDFLNPDAGTGMTEDTLEPTYNEATRAPQDPESAPEDPGTLHYGAASDYIFTVVDSSGTTQYTITDHTLYNNRTGEKRTLSNEELTHLLILLGVE